MSADPDIFGSFSSDAYRTPETQALPPFAPQTLGPEALPPDAPIINSHSELVVYDVLGTQKTGFVHTDAPAIQPNSWLFGRDLYKIDGAVGQEYF